MVDYQFIMRTVEPVRTCAACRTRRPQGVLMRVARHPAGGVLVDMNRARAPGRGVYLCRSLPCVELAARRQALRRALGVEVPASIYVELRQVAEQSGTGDE